MAGRTRALIRSSLFAALEAQLESEHDERTQLVRDKHDLERRLVEAHNRSYATVEEDAFHRVKKELKKTKALLKDTQTMLEKSQSEGSNKLLLRQLKTQVGFRIAKVASGGGPQPPFGGGLLTLSYWHRKMAFDHLVSLPLAAGRRRIRQDGRDQGEAIHRV